MIGVRSLSGMRAAAFSEARIDHGSFVIFGDAIQHQTTKVGIGGRASGQFDHPIDCLLAVGGATLEQAADLGTVGSPGCIQHGQGEGSFADVAARRLAEPRLICHQVEDIVGELEHESHLPRPLADSFDGFPIGATGHGSEAGRSANQARRLSADHGVVLVRAVIEIVGELQLENLALAEGGVGAGDQGHRFSAEWCRHLGGAGEKKVPGEDGDGVRPVLVDGDFAPPGVRLVDHVVVVERAEMDELDSDAGLDRAVIVPISQFGGDLCQQRAVALPACREPVLGDLGQERVVRGAGFE